MDKYTRDYILKTKGINGLKKVPRNLIPRTKRAIETEVVRGSKSGDLRNYGRNGVVAPNEDYIIFGEGRTPLLIREVVSEADGMRKYALVDMQQIESSKSKKTFGSRLRRSKPEQPSVEVRYVYSEKVELERMVEDREYAQALIGLFQEERLQEKQKQSAKRGSDIVYIGTLIKTDKGYIKAGIRDYEVAISGIAIEIENKREKMRREQQKLSENGRKSKNETSKERAKAIMPRFTSEQIAGYISDLEPKEREKVLRTVFECIGIEEPLKLLRDIHLRNTQGTPETNVPEGTEPED